MPPDSPEPGPFRVSRTPYLNDIYSAFASPLYKQIVGVMGAQMGKTECVFNVLGWVLDDRPTPCLYVGPTEKQVRSVSKSRIDAMFRSAASLWGKLEKGQRNQVAEKFVAGVRLGFAHAGSATELASHPCGLVLVDERDRMNATDEGDPVTMASARTKNYANGKVGIFSTPTIEGASPIWQLFLEGTKQIWCWPCGHCGEYFAPKISLLVWPDKATPQQAQDNTRLACPHCGGEHESHHKTELNRRGRYIAHRLSETDELMPDDDPPFNSSASFWVSGIASPWQSFGDIARRLVAAFQTHDHDKIQAEVNTYGGEVYKIKGEAPDWSEVADLRMPYKPGQVPEGVQIITMAVDVQKRGLYYSVRGWGFMSESWGIENGFIPGETAYDNVWILLQRQVDREYNGFEINRVFVDSGFNTGQVYAFARRNLGKVFAAKGQQTMDRPIRTAQVDTNVGGRTIKGGVKLFHVNSDYFKSQVHNRFRWPAGEPGGWHLHEETTEDYCKQVVAESLLIRSTGRRVWVQHSPDNHYFDCEYLNYACAHSLQVHALKPIDQAVAAEKVNRAVSKKTGGFVNPHKGGWFRR